MKLKNFILHLIVYIYIFIFITNCANPVAPTGGKKDVTPPKVLKCEPANRSNNFDKNKITIRFDEFFKLNDVKTQVIISPPFENNPDFKTRGKSLVIDLNERLKQNTTYTIFFGNAIADINEGNKLSNFQYVFSTGKTVDSLVIKGRVLNAFNRKPEKEVLVMLYVNTYDSVSFKEVPFYISKTNKKGEFELNNLRDCSYKIFALKDANDNYIYDLPNEDIAFADSLINPQIPFSMKIDTITRDSIVRDSIIRDSIINDSLNYCNNILFLFHEIDSTQRLVKAYLIQNGELGFIFKFPTKDVKIKPLNCELNPDWKIDEFNAAKDTLFCWLNLNNIHKDSILLEISDNAVVLDTTELPVVVIKPFQRRLKKKEKKKIMRLTFKSNVKNNSFDFFKTLKVICSHPVKEYDFSKILLIEEEDTLKPDIFFIDSVKRKFDICHKLKENTNYKLFFPDSIFTDIFNLSNDTTKIDFKTKSEEDYGKLILDLKLEKPGENYIIQLLNDKEDVLNEKFVTKSQIIKYEYLKPGKYLVKAILDKNHNNRWDTGEYLKKIQPERCFYFSKTVEVRANWDIEEEWKI